MPMPDLACPACAAPVQWVAIRRGLATCSTCGKTLRIPRRYARNGGLAAFALAGLLAYLVGFGGFALVVATIVGWIPAATVLVTVLRRVWPPNLEIDTGPYGP